MSVGWEDGVMEVEFRGGSLYRYECPREIFEEWQTAGFRGKHFHAHIRRVFEGVKQPRERDPLNG